MSKDGGSFLTGILDGIRKVSHIKWPKEKTPLAQNMKSWRDPLYLALYGSTGIYPCHLETVIE